MKAAPQQLSVDSAINLCVVSLAIGYWGVCAGDEVRLRLVTAESPKLLAFKPSAPGELHGLDIFRSKLKRGDLLNFRIGSV